MLNCRATCRSQDKKLGDNKLYLTGDLTSWNNAKRAEESERVKHTTDWFTSSGRKFIEE